MAGSETIECEHVLLGLLHDKDTTADKLFRLGSFEEEIRNKIASRRPQREPLPKHADLPLSNEAKCVLAYTLEEAERFRHNWIDTDHLLLGILREHKSFAAQILASFGFSLETARQKLVESSALRPDYGPLPLSLRLYRMANWFALMTFLLAGLAALGYIAHAIYRMAR